MIIKEMTAFSASFFQQIKPPLMDSSRWTSLALIVGRGVVVVAGIIVLGLGAGIDALFAHVAFV